MLITNFSLKGTFGPETERKLKQHHSTETTLIQTTDLILRAINRNRLLTAYTTELY